MALALRYAHRNARQQDFYWRKTTADVFGQSISLEFSSPNGVYSRGFCSRKALLSCVRTDIQEYLTNEYRSLETDVYGLVQVCRFSQQLFEFDRLTGLFVRELAPIQVLTRGNNAIFYSPADISVLGLA